MFEERMIGGSPQIERQSPSTSAGSRWQTADPVNIVACKLGMPGFPYVIIKLQTNNREIALGTAGDISPLQRQEQPTSDLYRAGIDAHCALPSNMPAEEPRGETSAFERGHSALSPARKLHKGKKAETKVRREKRMGQSIGSANHRRRSSVKPTNGTSKDTGTHRRSDADVFESFRRYSFIPIEVWTAGKAHRASLPSRGVEEARLQTAVRGRQQSSRDLLQGILDRAPTTSHRIPRSATHAGVVARRDSRRPSPAHESEPCVEDRHPHVCLDELLTPVSVSCNSSPPPRVTEMP